MYSPESAFNAGLIDILAENDEELLEIANSEMDKFLKIPAKARSITKSIIRGDLIKEFENTRHENTALGIKQLQDPVTQEIMRKYLASLGTKK